jgi:predicted AlkP superfamily pyrophosphatase or phosphodiesterase
MKRLLLLVLLILSAILGSPAQIPADRPYVVLVSLDGFRYDYAEKYSAQHVLAIRNEGAAASALIPVFPSLTFPNHTSIMTGLYPEHHGIVSNRFFDPARREEFIYSKNGSDGSFYRGTTLWALAERQGIHSAAMFWPGSDAEIGGVRPSYWFPYDAKFPDEARVGQVLDWLKMPALRRPHFITLYFSDVDGAGHDFGPEAPETRRAVEHVDQMIGRLWDGIRATRLPVNLILLSDHGMETVAGTVDLLPYLGANRVRIESSGSIALLYAPDAAAVEKTYLALKGKNSKVDVYRRKELPAEWHNRDDPRMGDVILNAREPVMLGKTTSRGAHGYDPRQIPNMRGIFYAAGPNIRAGARVDPFENIHIYPLVVRILGLSAPKIDGSPAVLQSLYRGTN